MPNDPSHLVSADASAEASALAGAMAALIEPMAELAVARGLPCPVVEELLRRAWVQAAGRAHQALPAHRRVSRVATSTGLSRREVTRLTQQAPNDHMPARRSLSSEVFARWIADPQWQQVDGRPLKLARTGPAPSFEALSRSVTKDVHPRALLEDLVRLNMVQLDAEADSVELLKDAFVPRTDRLRMIELMAANTSDHLRAAVDNVMGGRRDHLEQAVFADELSEESLRIFSRCMHEEWQSLMTRLIPILERLIADDAHHARPQDQRVRIGLYTYSCPTGDPREPQ